MPERDDEDELTRPGLSYLDEVDLEDDDPDAGIAARAMAAARERAYREVQADGPELD